MEEMEMDKNIDKLIIRPLSYTTFRIQIQRSEAKN